MSREKEQSWVDVKLFDFEVAQDFFSKHLSSLEYGALGIIEDNNVYMEVVRDGKFVASLQGITKCDRVEYTALGTPCIKYKFYQSGDEIIASYIHGEHNKKANKTIKKYTGNINSATPIRSFNQMIGGKFNG